jgi:hypothetical protein
LPASAGNAACCYNLGQVAPLVFLAGKKYSSETTLVAEPLKGLKAPQKSALIAFGKPMIDASDDAYAPWLSTLDTVAQSSMSIADASSNVAFGSIVSVPLGHVPLHYRLGTFVVYAAVINNRAAAKTQPDLEDESSEVPDAAFSTEPSHVCLASTIDCLCECLLLCFAYTRLHLYVHCIMRLWSEVLGESFFCCRWSANVARIVI